MQHATDSRYAAFRLAVVLALMTIGSGAMYVIALAEVGSDRPGAWNLRGSIVEPGTRQVRDGDGASHLAQSPGNRQADPRGAAGDEGSAIHMRCLSGGDAAGRANNRPRVP